MKLRNNKKYIFVRSKNYNYRPRMKTQTVTRLETTNKLLQRYLIVEKRKIIKLRKKYKIQQNFLLLSLFFNLIFLIFR